MLNLPLHTIDSTLEKEFEAYLKQVRSLNHFYELIHADQHLLFLFRDQAENYAASRKVQGKINLITTLLEQHTYVVAPCAFCNSPQFKSNDHKRIQLRFYEQMYLEDLCLKNAREAFEAKKIHKLQSLARDVLEHYNPESAVAHFYLGFCFYISNDLENYHLAIKNLKRFDHELSQQLAALNV